MPDRMAPERAAGAVDGLRVLPWISFNPSGKRDDGRGPTGLRIANFAWRWGFDGVAVYNAIHLQRPIRMKSKIKSSAGTSVGIGLCAIPLSRTISTLTTFAVLMLPSWLGALRKDRSGQRH